MFARSLVLVCLAAGAICVARPAAAQVYRCIGAHGEPEFSGQPCAAPLPSAATGAADAADGTGSLCAASPGVLRNAVAQAFAARDVNRLAGVMLWRGVDQASARAVLRALAAWMQRPLTGIADVRAGGPPEGAPEPAPASAIPAPAPAASAPAPPPIAFAVSTGGVDGSTRDFSLVRSGGCWWLTP